MAYKARAFENRLHDSNDNINSDPNNVMWL